MEREPHEFDERDPDAAGADAGQGADPPTDEALDVEAPNESGPGHNPEPGDPDGGATRP